MIPRLVGQRVNNHVLRLSRHFTSQRRDDGGLCGDSTIRVIL